MIDLAQLNKKSEMLDIFKVYLINILSFIAILFCFSLGLKGISTSSPILTTLLFFAGIVIILNLIYLKKTKNDIVSGSIFIYTFYLLMFYLVYTGGVDGNTGPLWIFYLAPLTFYIKGLKTGIFNIMFFLLVLFIILYVLESNSLKAEYADAYKLRILLAFILTSFVSAAYEYSRNISYKYAHTLQKELEYIALFDDLTGTYNRRGYRKHLKNIEMSNGTILMCDIDKFKKINDKYGHLAGDYCIKEVARRIKENLRSDDLVVRWGGDEFFVYLSNINIDDAQIVAEKIQTLISNKDFIFQNKSIHMSISIGLAPLSKFSSLEETIREADNNMYLSKYKNELEI